MPQLAESRYGLPQGFVRFGTVAHLLLRAMHDHGPLRQSDFVRILDIPKGQVSLNIRRLRDAKMKFIYWHGKVRVDHNKVQDLWSLNYRTDKAIDHKPYTRAELSDRWRQKRSTQVASVWQFRPIVKQKCKQPKTT